MLTLRRDPRNAATYRVVITMFVPGSGTWEFVSLPMDEMFAKVLVWSLSDGGPFKIEKAKKVKDQ